MQLVLRHWEHFHVDIQSFQDMEGARGTNRWAWLLPAPTPGMGDEQRNTPKILPQKKKAWKQKAGLIAGGSGDSVASQARAQICIP